jgi:DNA-directed DNA polymerase III PolC
MENKALEIIKSKLLRARCNKETESRLNKELRYLAFNENEAEELLRAYEQLRVNGIKTTNPGNSMVIYALGMTDSVPQGVISQTETNLPDIDYDTDDRDSIYEGLVKQHGPNRVTKLGTHITSKTKGAIKDMARAVAHDLTPQDVDRITKQYDSLKATDYKTEQEFFQAGIDSSAEVKTFFEQRPVLKDLVSQYLGNAKTTGVHAGGVVVSSKDIRRIVPLTKDRNSDAWVTQPDMHDVEKTARLIKYDFLGLNTLADLRRFATSVRRRHDTNFDFLKIPLNDQDVLNEFTKGNTITVFQFNTPLATGILKRIKRINSLMDLALITSVARPGPLNMKMDESFVRRINGEEPISYEHPSLESVLKETYGILIFQEQVMQIAQSLGGLSGDESLTVMKAMGKKDRERLANFKNRFLSNAEAAHKVPAATAQRIWDQMESFAEYGFNKSHAVCYALISYWCMWAKTKHELDWVMSVFDGADKDDYKIMFEKWKHLVMVPNINYSRANYYINEEKKMVATPLSSINGVGEKAVEAICAAQPFADVTDFFNRIDKRKVNKGVIQKLVFSGSMDIFREESQSINKFRKEALKLLIALRHKAKKPSKEDAAADAAFIEQLENLTRGQMLMQEIRLTNAVGFDYHVHYKDNMTRDSKSIFGQEALRPEKALLLANKVTTVIGGAVESSELVPIRSGKFINQNRLILKVSNAGESIEVVVWPWTLEKDKANGGELLNITDFTPIIIKGEVSHYKGKVSMSLIEAIIIK